MCPDCIARAKLARDAFLNAQYSEAAKQVATGAAEMVGLKKKSGVSDAAGAGTPKRKPKSPSAPATTAGVVGKTASTAGTTSGAAGKSQQE